MFKRLLFLIALVGTSAAQAQSRLEAQDIIETNLLKNGGFENGLVGWAETGAGTLALETTDVAFGSASGSWDASATSEKLYSADYTIPRGFVGNYCSAQIMYKGGDANLTFQVVDDNDAVLDSGTLAAQTNYTFSGPLFFPCGNSNTDTLAVEITSSADAAIIYVDKVFIGQASTAGASVAVTGWETYSVGELTNWTSSARRAIKRRIGDSIEIIAEATVDTPSGLLQWGPLPSGHTVSTTLTDFTNRIPVGRWNISDGSAFYSGISSSLGATGVIRFVTSESSYVTATGPVPSGSSITTGDEISIHVKYPISGWEGKGTLPVFTQDNLTELTSYSTVSNLTSNIETQGGYYRQVGDVMEFQSTIEFSGANTDSSMIPAIPGDCTPDETKMVSGLTGTSDWVHVGSWVGRGSGTRYDGEAYYDIGSDTIFLSEDGASVVDPSNNEPFIVADADLFTWSIKIPCTEFAGSQRSAVMYTEASATTGGLVSTEEQELAGLKKFVDGVEVGGFNFAWMRSATTGTTIDNTGDFKGLGGASSVTDNAVGHFTINWESGVFSSSSYSCTCNAIAGGAEITCTVNNVLAGSVDVYLWDSSATDTNADANYTLMCAGAA